MLTQPTYQGGALVYSIDPNTPLVHICLQWLDGRTEVRPSMPDAEYASELGIAEVGWKNVHTFRPTGKYDDEGHRIFQEVISEKPKIADDAFRREIARRYGARLRRQREAAEARRKQRSS